MSDKTIDKGKAAAIGAVAALSVAIGGAFDSPVDLVKKEEVLFPSPVVQTVQAIVDDDDPEENDEQEENESEKKLTVREKFRQWILRLPVGVRAVLGVPLWACGFLLNQAAGLLWNLLLSPLLSHLLRWLVFSLILLGVLALTLKLLFPNIPWKKLLNKKTVLAVFLFTALLELADLAVPLFWEDWNKWKLLARAALTGVFLTAVTVRLSRFHKRHPLPIPAAN